MTNKDYIMNYKILIGIVTAIIMVLTIILITTNHSKVTTKFYSDTNIEGAVELHKVSDSPLNEVEEVFHDKDNSTEQELPKLMLVVDNSNPEPGDIVNFTAQFLSNEAGVTNEELTRAIAESGAIAGLRLWSEEGINEFDKTYPYQWSISLPMRSSGIDEFQTSTLFGSEIITSNIVQMLVELEMSLLNQIYFSPGEEMLLLVGNSTMMNVVGRFSDGYERNITKEYGTIYSENIVIDNFSIISGDSPSINISEEGMVTALQQGVAEVVATNNGVTNVRRITVVDN